MSNKYVNHLPLERQVQNFPRCGYNIPKATLQDLIGVADPLYENLVHTLKSQLLQNRILYSDDNKIPVQDRSKTLSNRELLNSWQDFPRL